MLRLDYLSCCLTVLSTVLIGRRKWHGWIVAAMNSAIITVIGIRTQQTGFIPANLFCIAIYGYNILQWRNSAQTEQKSQPEAMSDTLHSQSARHVPRRFGRRIRHAFADERLSRFSNRVRQRSLPHQR